MRQDSHVFVITLPTVLALAILLTALDRTTCTVITSTHSAAHEGVAEEV